MEVTRSRRPGLILWDNYKRYVQGAREDLALMGAHPDRVFDVQQLPTQRRAIKVEAALVEELLHRPARLFVGFAELLNEGFHTIVGTLCPFLSQATGALCPHRKS